MNEMLSLEGLMPARFVSEQEEREIEREAIFGSVENIDMRVRAGERGDELLWEAHMVVTSALGSRLFDAFDELAARLDECLLHEHAEQVREHIREQEALKHDEDHRHDHEKEKKTKRIFGLGRARSQRAGRAATRSLFDIEFKVSPLIPPSQTKRVVKLLGGEEREVAVFNN